jgi:hypothetical protein
LSPFYEVTEDGVRLFVRVSPGARGDAVAGVWSGAEGEVRLAIKVTAPPDKGKANAAILKLLSKALGLPKSALLVASGETSRLKTVVIRIADKAALAAALDALAGEKK